MKSAHIDLKVESTLTKKAVEEAQAEIAKLQKCYSFEQKIISLDLFAKNEFTLANQKI